VSTVALRKIVSGGQTGADRAALDAARVWHIEWGGYVPAGRLAEDGRISETYANLVETAADDYNERTRMNVLHSDGTLIVSHGALSGGSLFTWEVAEDAGKPCRHLDLDRLTMSAAVLEIEQWLSDAAIVTLNVAGPRASQDPRIYAATLALVSGVLARRLPDAASADRR